MSCTDEGHLSGFQWMCCGTDFEIGFHVLTRIDAFYATCQPRRPEGCETLFLPKRNPCISSSKAAICGIITLFMVDGPTSALCERKMTQAGMSFLSCFETLNTLMAVSGLPLQISLSQWHRPSCRCCSTWCRTQSWFSLCGLSTIRSIALRSWVALSRQPRAMRSGDNIDRYTKLNTSSILAFTSGANGVRMFEK